MEFRTQYRNPVEDHGEVTIGKSMTVPDMSYQIRDLLENFTSVPDIYLDGYYDDDPDIDFINPLQKIDKDLTDVEETENWLNELSSSLIEQEKKAKAKKAESEAISEKSDQPIKTVQSEQDFKS